MAQKNTAHLSDGTRARLSKYIRDNGDRISEERFGMTVHTLLRAAAGCGVRRLTAEYLEGCFSSDGDAK